MKKIFTLIAVTASGFLFAQTNDSIHKNTISVNGMYSEPGQIGLSYERHASSKKSHMVNLSYGVMNYDADIVDVDGTGFVIELGSRNYFNKSNEGFYGDNYLSYGSIKFDEETPFGKFEGTYSYFSFFAPEIGYKIKFGNVSIDPYIGGMWKIEIKGKGDIDNNNTDEWVMRGGIKVGYSF